jgi:hypothetical protein
MDTILKNIKIMISTMDKWNLINHMVREFISFGVSFQIKNLTFIKEFFKMDSILDLVNFAKWLIKNKLFIVIRDIGNMVKEKEMEDKIIMLIVLCIIMVNGQMISGKDMEFLSCLMEAMMVNGLMEK